MIEHNDTLISLNVLEKDFVCNLAACKGRCCIEGDFGAPLEEDELDELNENLEGIMPYMDEEGLELLAQDGYSETDPDGDLVTTCRSDGACVFATQDEKGVYACSIELAHKEGKSSFKKPISCHLYPIRLNSVASYTALNYSSWDICDPACKLGSELNVPVYKFLKEPLIRRFGKEYYQDLEAIAIEYEQFKDSE